MSLMLLLLLLHSGFRQAGVSASDPVTCHSLSPDWPGSPRPVFWLADMTLTHSNHQRLWAGSCDSEQVS